MNVVTVDAHEVVHGDVLAGVPDSLRSPIESILWCSMISDEGERGYWIYADIDGRELARRPLGGRVQVIRGQDVEGAGGPSLGLTAVAPSTTSRPGITRRHGMWAVRP